jgi:hypothetical protein
VLQNNITYNIMDKEIEEKFIKLLERVEDPELKSEFLKCFFEVSDEIEQLKIQSRGCMPCISNCVCQDNEICNGNDVDAKVDV